MPISHRDLMLATPASSPFDSPGWLYELRYDGYRAIAIRQGDKARLISRRGNDLSPRFPEIIECLLELPECVLDAELVMLDDKGRPHFERLRRRAMMRKEISIRNAAQWEPAVLFVFDMLSVRGKDLRKLRLLKRKEAVQHVVGSVLGRFRRVRVVQHVGEQGQRLYDSARELGLEGIMAKRADSAYRAGRSRDWLKIRTPRRVD
jgi:bifunctional non-homologous end joining protein LigD